jgi:hypothetical protein
MRKYMNSRTITCIILLTGLAAMLALNLPGQMSADSVWQLYQGRTGIYDSWHPPVMAWLLGVFDSLLQGTSLFVLFNALLLAGSWLLLLGLGRKPGWTTVLVAAILVLSPQWLLHQGTVWKDILFTDAAIAGFVALALAGAHWASARGIWLCAFVLLLSLAALTRQNGLLLLPVGALALGWIAARRGRSALAYGFGALVLTGFLTAAGTWALNLRGDNGEGERSVLRIAQSYDLIGALKHAPSLPLSPMAQQDAKLVALMRDPGVALYSPLLNDTLAKSPALMAAIADAPNGLIFAQWENLVLDHPSVYAAMRWPVFRWVLAAPDVSLCHPAFVGIEGSPEYLKPLDLTARIRPQDRMLASYAKFFMGTPVLSHLTFLGLALVMLVVLLRRGRAGDIAMAGMLTAALVFTASFFIVSIACDYRYLAFLDMAALTASFYFACDPRATRTT